MGPLSQWTEQNNAVAAQGAWGGIVAPAVFIASWLVNGVREPDYSPFTEPISRLARADAKHHVEMRNALFAFGLLLPMAARPIRRHLHAGTGVELTVGLAGVATAAIGALPLSVEGGRPVDTAHAVAAGVGYIGMAAAPLLGGAALFRRGRVAMGIASILLGGASGASLIASTRTRHVGLFQRLGLTLVDAWLMTVSWQTIKASGRRSAR